VNQSLDLLSIGIQIAIVLIALTIHEAAHAWTADKLGDPTARLLGRVSLNPVVHIDPIGTILLPLIAAWSNFPIIGWAKPVPVNTSRFRHPRQSFMVVAAAGPISNLLQAVVAALVLHVIVPEGRNVTWMIGDGSILAFVLANVVGINVFLALFNLIPVPPLDGGNVLAGLLPPGGARVIETIRPFGFIVLYALMFTGVLSALVVPPAFFLVRILLP
jgi:Zn-dependent protease